MRTRLFHTIVLFGAALGGAVACSDGDEDSNDTQQESSVGGSDASGGSSGDASGGAATGGAGGAGVHVAGSTGWPPTK